MDPMISVLMYAELLCRPVHPIHWDSVTFTNTWAEHFPCQFFSHVLAKQLKSLTMAS